MPEPVTSLTTAVLLKTCAINLLGGIARGAGNSLFDRSKKFFRNWSAVRKAVSATRKRHKYPGISWYLKKWRRSSSFTFLLNQAETGKLTGIEDDYVAKSFVEAVGSGLGWGSETMPRAKEVSRTFIENLYIEFVRGPDGRVFMHRLQDARHKQSQLERELIRSENSRDHARLQESVDQANRVLQYVGTQLGTIPEDLKAQMHQEVFPRSLQNAVAKPNLDELSELMKSGHAKDALAFAIKHVEIIDTSIEEANDSSGRIADALRTYRQRFLFAAASSASWLGDKEAGRMWWQRARDLGPIDPECYEQAAAALFNIGLSNVDDLRNLMSQMDPDSEVYKRTIPLLAFLEGNWQIVDEQLASASGVDLILARVRARLHLFNPQDTGEVQSIVALLDQTDREDILATLSLVRAQATLELLTRVIEDYTPLTFDRRHLVDNLVLRIESALKATQPNPILYAQALATLLSSAKLLRDELQIKIFEQEIETLDESVRSNVFFMFDPAPGIEEIDRMFAAGQINIGQSLELKLSHFSSKGQREEIKRLLYESLYSAQDKRQRAHVLRLLAHHLRKTNQSTEVDKLLETVPLRLADKWLLRVEFILEEEHLANAASEVEKFPLDVNVLAYLANSTLAKVRSKLNGDSKNQENVHRLADSAASWAERLLKVLPSRSSRILFAEAQYAAKRYDALLTASEDLDPTESTHAIELKAWALEGLGRRIEAANLLVAACKDFPDIERLAVNASAILLADDRTAEVIKLLEPRVDSGSKELGILVNFARALLADAPGSREIASRAFDVLSDAYELYPEPNLAAEAWKAARGAGREKEAGHLFAAMVENAHHATINSPTDFDAVASSEGFQLVQFDENFEVLEEQIRRDKERAKAINEISSAHILAYVDQFRLSGRSWENWTLWTQRYNRLKRKGKLPSGTYSVLTDWPSATMQHTKKHGNLTSLFADPTAILSLGIIGSEDARKILDALGAFYVQTGTIEGLREERNRIETEIHLGGEQSYIEVESAILALEGAVVQYSEEIEAVAPKDETVGAARVDLGAAVHCKALYVADDEFVREWSEEVRRVCISSSVLLSALNKAGLITADKARIAADRHPNSFGGWDQIDPPLVPETVVFNQFTLLNWVDAGLVDALKDRIKVGPWAWTYISAEAENRKVLKLAHERIKELLILLKELESEGKLIELGLDSELGVSIVEDFVSDKKEPQLTDIWKSALKSLQIASSNGLQLWADDRFYSLLLWMGGPTIVGPEIESIRSKFVVWAKDKPPLSTVELLEYLSSSNSLNKNLAQDVAAYLFSYGYRMVHSILLNHAIRQFPAPTELPLTTPFQNLVDAVLEIPDYLPESIDLTRREGFTRVASKEVVERFIVCIWQSEQLSIDNRKILADSFLNALEDIFARVSRVPVGPRSDLTHLYFWRAISSALYLMPAHDVELHELKKEALKWLGEAASRRSDRRQDIARLLADNLLSFVPFVRKALEERTESPVFIFSQFFLPAFIPFIESELLDTFDPLLRRTVGTLLELQREGRTDVHTTIQIEGKDIEIVIHEEDHELAAIDILKRAGSGDSSVLQLFQATDIVFQYSRTPSEDWIIAGVPSGHKLAFNVRCSLFTLLWSNQPDLQETIIQYLIFTLANIDVALAHRVIELKEDLLSISPEVAQNARNKLALDVMESGFFELQRDLTHACWRYRDFEPRLFSRFLGWIGEAAGSTVKEYMAGIPVQLVGEAVVPLGHYIGRSLLTEQFDDEELVVSAIEDMYVSQGGQSNIEEELPTLQEWLANRALVAENSDDPFTAAWSLRQILLVFTVADDDPELHIQEQRVSTSEWCEKYIQTALTVGKAEPSQLEQRMVFRRGLTSASFLLSAFACSGEKHFTSYNKEKDPLEVWLDHVWQLASKLQVALIHLKGGLVEAVAAAQSSVIDLDLANPKARVLDAFDPYSFGYDGDDIGAALTLTAIYKALLRSKDKNTDWLTEKVKKCVMDLTTAPQANRPDQQHGNRFGLIAPLRTQELARLIIKHIE